MKPVRSEMDNLLCEESWLSSPLTPEPSPNFRPSINDDDLAVMSPAIDAATMDEAISMDVEKELCNSNHGDTFRLTVDEAISMDLEKELSFSNHGDTFLEFFVSKKLTDARFQAVQWLIQTRSRLNLSFETLFSAASCFDRFVYVTSCNDWTNWMVELVAVTSLSIASKFNEVTSPSLQKLQMNGLNHIFHHKTILETEVIMLKALEWRVNLVTSYSFSQTLVSKIGLAGDHSMMNRITHHLLDDLCDVKMLQYPPSVVAVGALWNVLAEKAGPDDSLGSIINLFGQERKENIMKCVEVMKHRRIDHCSARRKACEVKSLVNGDYHVGELSAIFRIIRSEGSTNKKRDRENNQDNILPARKKNVVMSI